jgi:hypothetical protein
MALLRPDLEQALLELLAGLTLEGFKHTDHAMIKSGDPFARC